MSRSQDEARRLRVREADRTDIQTRTDRDPAFGSPSLVAQTKTLSSYPGTAQRFYACVPVVILGTETEGGAGSVTVESSTFLALNLGTAVPPVGTNILATFVESRWVFRYDG